MPNFWESKFTVEQTMWGFEPSDSAISTKDFFLENKIRDVLIPGIGYGRNAKIFHENGINITGIEISKTAIQLAKTENGINAKIYQGSVTEMPFDDKLYDGIFCYALVHLLNSNERIKFIQDCYKQLKPNGYMIYTVVSKNASMYGNGKQLSKDRFELQKGLNVFFYDSKSIEREFQKYGLIEYSEIDEPIKHIKDEPPLKCILVKCKKNMKAS